MKFFILVSLFFTGVLEQNLFIAPFEESKSYLELEMQSLQNSLMVTDLHVSTLNKKNNIFRNVNDTMVTKTRMPGVLKNNITSDNKIIKYVDREVQVLVFGLTEKKNTYKVCVEGICGVMEEIYLTLTDDIKRMKNRVLRDRTLAVFDKRVEERKSLEAMMIEKYGKKQFEKMKEGVIWIGMNKEQCKFTLGEPSKVNTDVGHWGTHEQWIYPDAYVYFKNDKLTSFQY